MENLKILTKENFTKEVLSLIETKNMTAMDAIIHFAEKQNLELESISRLIDKSLKERIESEASKLNLMKKVVALPI